MRRQGGLAVLPRRNTALIRRPPIPGPIATASNRAILVQLIVSLERTAIDV
jgi:hypothetical protein